MNWNVIYRIHTNFQYLTFIFMNYSGKEDGCYIGKAKGKSKKSKKVCSLH